MPSVRTVLSHMARMQSLWCARQRTLRHSSRQASARGLAYLLSWGNKPWERLAQRLKDEKVESVYVDRLEGKLGRKVRWKIRSTNWSKKFCRKRLVRCAGPKTRSTTFCYSCSARAWISTRKVTTWSGGSSSATSINCGK